MSGPEWKSTYGSVPDRKREVEALIAQLDSWTKQLVRLSEPQRHPSAHRTAKGCLSVIPLEVIEQDHQCVCYAIKDMLLVWSNMIGWVLQIEKLQI